jgi:hypothetical protein
MEVLGLEADPVWAVGIGINDRLGGRGGWAMPAPRPLSADVDNAGENGRLPSAPSLSGEVGDLPPAGAGI